MLNLSLNAWTASPVHVLSMTCDRSGATPLFWIVMGGHLRSFPFHVEQTRTLVGESRPCAFLVAFVRKYQAEGSLGFGQKLAKPIIGNVERDLRDAKVENMAYVITESSSKIPRVWAHLDTWFGGTLAIQEVERQTGRVPQGVRDGILFTRPDIVFSRSLDVASLLRKQRVAIYFAHSSRRMGTGNDPTELAHIVSRDVWSDMLRMCDTKLNAAGTGVRICKRPLDLFAEAPEAANASLYYARKDAGFFIHRMGGRYVPLHGASSMPHTSKEPLDLSRDLVHFHSARWPSTASLRSTKGLIWHRFEPRKHFLGEA